MNDKPSLTKLFKNNHLRNLIWDIVSEDFDSAFERITRELKELQSPLLVKAKSNREYVKEMFIEYGQTMETCSDLKKILDKAPNYCENDWSADKEND